MEKARVIPFSWQTVEKGDQLDRWLELLGQYTKPHLTRSEDLLPAIAGVARGIADFIGDEYHADLFRSSLPESLLWHQDYQYLTANAMCNTPTWSWARSYGPKTFRMCRPELDAWNVHCIARDISVLPAVDHDSLGCTESGHSPFLVLVRSCLQDERPLKRQCQEPSVLRVSKA